MREVINARRWLVWAGAQRRRIPQGLPRRKAVYQQTPRWLGAGCFAAIVHDLRTLHQVVEGCAAAPTAFVQDGRTLHPTPKGGGRSSYERATRRNGSKAPFAVDTLGNLLADQVTPANEQQRAQVEILASQVQEVTGQTVELAYLDQVYTGEQPAADAQARGIQLEVVKLPEAKHGFVFLRRRSVVERRFAWTARFRRLAPSPSACPKP